MSIEGIEQDVLNWHSDIFPNATKEAVDDKLLEETIEFINVFRCVNSTNEDYWDELADVIITNMVFIAKHTDRKISLADIIRRKLEINKAREWGPELPDGNRERVK